jgi:RNA polymerase sigma factor (sigma-70 family)
MGNLYFKKEEMVEKNLGNTLSNDDYPFQVILERAIQGDEKAFKHIYDSLAGKMYSLCVRYAGNSNDANDMFQEAFIRVYRSLAAYKGVGVFEGWVRKIFVNTCLDHLKNKQRLLYSELNSYTDVRTSSDLDGIEKISKEELIKIIQQLPNGYRLVVNLYLVEGYSHKEISEMLGIAEGTSKSQLSRARLLLQKEILEKNG